MANAIGKVFRDEGASPLDRLPLRISPGVTPAVLAAAWRSESPWLSTWDRVDPDVGRVMVEALCNLAVASGVAWVITSDFRDSPSHKVGAAVDVAPRPADWSLYAASRGIDPLLNGRAEVLAHLQAAAAATRPTRSRALTLFAEDDHVHAHLHRGTGVHGRLWPLRTHHSYKSGPCDHHYRSNPHAFKPRF